MVKAVQQIMLGSVTGSEAAAKETLRRIKAAGYDALELNRFMIHPSSLMVRMMTRAAGMPTGKGGKLDWPSLMQEAGLSVLSLHTDLGSLENDFDGVLADAAALDTQTLVITGMYRYDYSNAASVTDLARRLNKAGEKVREKGLTLLYHNHNVELLRPSEGEHGYELLIRETDPELIGFEFDSFWFAEAGADPLEWMDKLGQRMKLWHVTDRGSRLVEPAMTPILKSDSMELGTGNMPLSRLYAKAADNGIRGIVLESHRNWINGSPLESLEKSAQWFYSCGSSFGGKFSE